MARPIDANELMVEIQACNWDSEQDRERTEDLVLGMPTLSPWVSVEERLPKPDFKEQQRGFYLVALSNGVVKELAYEFKHYDNMLFDIGWHETAFPVTHWMNLPEPPEKGW